MTLDVKMTPALSSLDKASLLTAIDMAARGQDIRKEEMANSDQVMREATPGSLELEAK